MPSNPGQNPHLVSSQIHAVASSSHLANSSSQLVVLSSYLVESSSHLVVSSILLTSPLLVYSSVILQLVVSHFNSPFSISVYLSECKSHIHPIPLTFFLIICTIIGVSGSFEALIEFSSTIKLRGRP